VILVVIVIVSVVVVDVVSGSSFKKNNIKMCERDWRNFFIASELDLAETIIFQSASSVFDGKIDRHYVKSLFVM
jgi:hypothetical protein